MPKPEAVIIAEANLSVAWLRAMEAALKDGSHELTPLVLTVTGFGPDGVPQEVPEVRTLIDSDLAHVAAAEEAKKVSKTGKPSRRPLKPLTCRTVASTIFPSSLWNPALPRQILYDRYLKIYPQVQREPANRRGTYFHRLIQYPAAPCGGNQLESIIKMYNDRVGRRSAFQAPIAYPAKDMIGTPLLGFPCLQQIAFTPDRKQGTLAVTGFYGLQYLFERAYGNYLGLARLGHFVAIGMGLGLGRMTCVAAVGEVEIGAAHARDLVKKAREAAIAAGVLK